MKLINKLMAIAIALLAMVAVCACSSYEDPDVAFKGNVDGNFLNALARGETSVTFSKKDSKSYEMDYAAYLNGTGKWDDEPKDQLGGGGLGYDKLVIINGRTWSPLELYDKSTLAPSLLVTPWKVFCKETGYNKDVYVACPMEFDAESKSLKIGELTYSVEKAEGNELTLSRIGQIYQINDQTGDFEITKAYKTVVFYKKAAMETPDMNQVVYFDSEKDAKLGMIAMLREHFGDIIDLNHYGHMYTFSILNLAIMEENIRNGLDEDANDALTHDPKSPY